MKMSRVVALVASVAVNLLIVGFLILWVVPVTDIARLPTARVLVRLLTSV